MGLGEPQTKADCMRGLQPGVPLGSCTSRKWGNCWDTWTLLGWIQVSLPLSMSLCPATHSSRMIGDSKVSYILRNSCINYPQILRKHFRKKRIIKDSVRKDWRHVRGLFRYCENNLPQAFREQTPHGSCDVIRDALMTLPLPQLPYGSVYTIASYIKCPPEKHLSESHCSFWTRQWREWKLLSYCSVVRGYSS